MRLLDWDRVPKSMKNEAVYQYYKILCNKKVSLLCKRAFDVIASIMLIILLFPMMSVISVTIKLDSKGPILFKQVRITQYGKKFKIYKFRTMIQGAEALGSNVTAENDTRITKVGKKLRKYRLDEIPQLFNVLKGEMTFVGIRPEVPKFVRMYTDEMKATLLLPAGITSKASIEFRDEDQLIGNAIAADKVYIDKVLPAKMSLNLQAIKDFSFWQDIKILIQTAIAVVK